ncbi:hypothetical protein O3P69_020644 [Scylla paramamosain]|uniref:Galactosylceramide sulfotransferase n=1 Tax=Scylla paramamosain TaxID=85552 RepID=A0AAW0TM42_SCYPA
MRMPLPVHTWSEVHILFSLVKMSALNQAVAAAAAEAVVRHFLAGVVPIFIWFTSNAFVSVARRRPFRWRRSKDGLGIAVFTAADVSPQAQHQSGDVRGGSCDAPVQLFLAQESDAVLNKNILFRYGDKHNLHFALPEVGNYFGGGKHTFKAAMVRSSPLNKVTPNIFAIHTKWDHVEVKKVMPEDTLFVTIVREPTALFQSVFSYSMRERVLGLTLDQYVRQVNFKQDRSFGYLGYNQMILDFGMPLEDVNNLTAVREMVRWADEQFGLVLVMERMEESLVLLAEYLCWELSDVLVLRVNSLREKFKPSISEEAWQALQQKLTPDYMLYNHFLERFNLQVEAFGQARMAAAVAKLQELMALLISTCNFVSKEASELREGQKPWSDKVSVQSRESSSHLAPAHQLFH